MTSCEKLPKLIERMQRLVTYLDNRNELAIHQHIDQSFYMQKVEELKILLHQFEETQKSLDAITTRIENHYKLCSSQWYKDQRWLHARRLRERVKPIL